MNKLDSIQQAAEGAKVCPDCGNEQWFANTAATYDPEVHCLRHCEAWHQELACEQRATKRLRSRIAELEAALGRAERLVYGARAYLQRTLHSCEALDGVSWGNGEVVEMVEQIDDLLTTEAGAKEG